MLPAGEHQQAKPTLLRRVLSVLIRAAVLVMLLFVLDKLMPSIS